MSEIAMLSGCKVTKEGGIELSALQKPWCMSTTAEMADCAPLKMRIDRGPKLTNTGEVWRALNFDFRREPTLKDRLGDIVNGDVPGWKLFCASVDSSGLRLEILRTEAQVKTVRGQPLSSAKLPIQHYEIGLFADNYFEVEIIFRVPDGTKKHKTYRFREVREKGTHAILVHGTTGARGFNWLPIYESYVD